jgi:hypothetical protein
VDDHNGKAIDLSLYIRPEKLNGFQAGFSYYRTALHPAALPSIDENIFVGHAVYMSSKFEWLNEAALIRNGLTGQNVTYQSLTAYTELSYAFGKTRPFFRYDYQNVPTGDPFFGILGRQNGPSIGINRRLSPYVIFKVQYGRLAERLEKTTNVIQAMLAFAF